MALEDLSADAQELFQLIKAAPGQTVQRIKKSIGKDQFVLNPCPKHLLREELIAELLRENYLIIADETPHQINYQPQPQNQ